MPLSAEGSCSMTICVGHEVHQADLDRLMEARKVTKPPEVSACTPVVTGGETKISTPLSAKPKR